MLSYKVIGMFNVQYHCETMILYNMSILICIAVAVPVLKKDKKKPRNFVYKSNVSSKSDAIF